MSSDTPFSATGTFDKEPTTVENVSAVWISSDPTIVTVDSSSGVASCVAVGGPITITASAGEEGKPILRISVVWQFRPAQWDIVFMFAAALAAEK